MSRLVYLLTLAAVGLAGCSQSRSDAQPAPPANSTEATLAPVVPTEPGLAQPTVPGHVRQDAAPPVQAVDWRSLTLGGSGLGPIGPNMPTTADTLQAVLAGCSAAPDAGGIALHCGKSQGTPSIYVAAANGAIERIDVYVPQVAGPHGLRVGSTFAELARVTPIAKCWVEEGESRYLACRFPDQRSVWFSLREKDKRINNRVMRMTWWRKPPPR